MLKNNQLWRVFLAVWVVVILVLCLMPAPDLPKEPSFPQFDKLVHFTLYFILSGLFLLAYPNLRSGRGLVWLFLFVVFLGGSVEILQLVLPIQRTASLADMMANLAGTLALVGVFRTVFKRISD